MDLKQQIEYIKTNNGVTLSKWTDNPSNHKYAIENTYRMLKLFLENGFGIRIHGVVNHSKKNINMWMII